MPGAA